MLPVRLDSGLLRLLAVVAAVSVAAMLFNPGLPIVLVPALVFTFVAGAISYRRNPSESWWKIPVAIFIVATALSLVIVFYLLAQK